MSERVLQVLREILGERNAEMKGDTIKAGHAWKHGSRSGNCLVVWPDSARWFCSSCETRGDLADLLVDAGKAGSIGAGWQLLAEHGIRPPSKNGHEGVVLALPFRTAPELAALAPEKPEWVVKGLLAKGAITEVSSKVKVGKTSFALSMIRATLSGEPFLSLPTRPAGIVYLTEEREATVREVLARTGLLDAANLHLLHLHDTKGIEWSSVVTSTVAHAHRVEADALVVDTLSRWARIHGDEENSAGAVAAAMEPLEHAAAVGLAILVLRHDRKSGGAVGDSGRGSSAFAGAADVLLHLQRADAPGHETRRILQGVGRFDATPAQLTLELRDGKYVSLGDALTVERNETKTKVLDVLPTSVPGITEAEIVGRTESSRSTVKRVLKELVQCRTVACGKGAGTSGRALWVLVAWRLQPTQLPYTRGF